MEPESLLPQSLLLLLLFLLQIKKAVLFGTAGYCNVVFFNYSVSFLMSRLMDPCDSVHVMTVANYTGSYSYAAYMQFEMELSSDAGNFGI